MDTSEWFKKFHENIKREIPKELLQFTQDVQEESSTVHTYTTKSGNLDRAYTTQKKNWHHIVWFLDKYNKNAPYAYAIALGRPDWPNYKPDNFVGNAIDKFEPKLELRIMEAVGRALP